MINILQKFLLFFGAVVLCCAENINQDGQDLEASETAQFGFGYPVVYPYYRPYPVVYPYFGGGGIYRGGFGGYGGFRGYGRRFYG